MSPNNTNLICEPHGPGSQAKDGKKEKESILSSLGAGPALEEILTRCIFDFSPLAPWNPFSRLLHIDFNRKFSYYLMNMSVSK